MSATDPKVLVFQHIPVEHPGVFRDFLREDGIGWRAVELDAGESIPDLGAYDALWVMGGPMDVWEDDLHPWLEAERAAIREAVLERKMPFLGFCLGHQLLAQALGGAVGPAAEPEIGIREVVLTEEGRTSPIFEGVPVTHACLQWHGAEVLQPPPGARILAAAQACAVQALGVGSHAFSIQYHVEITDRTVPEWGAVPAYGQALERALGAGALAGFEAEAAAGMADFNRNARRIYDNFMRISGNRIWGSERCERGASPKPVARS
jgi:GMP synthase-like glutamine amidotransferase